LVLNQSTPIVEFVKLKYDTKRVFNEKYFEDKRRYGILAKLTEIISLMIQGLHPKMINSFVAVKCDRSGI